MAGASTIEPDDVRSLLHSLIVPCHDYESQCWVTNVLDKISLDLHSPEPSSIVIPMDWLKDEILLSFADVRDLKVPYRVFEMYYLQRLIGSIISKCLDRLANRSCSLLLLDPLGHHLVLWAVRLASTIYRASGRRGKAMSLLEIFIHLLEQDLDLQDAINWWNHNEMLIELAHCCAEDGHWDEARRLLNTQFKKAPKSEETMAYMCRSRPSGEVFDILERRLLHSGGEALQFIGGLENGCADTQEHQTRLQEGSCQQGISEWGPFLTDCIEWDKI